VRYENPEIPEGINYSREHPLREFALLASAVLAAVVVLVAALALSAEHLARLVPFQLERALAERAGQRLLPAPPAGAAAPRRAYLQALAERLGGALELPADMPITVHYLDDDTVNAFATLGGNIFVYRGLFERLEHENALAMVLAHEIAHVRHRDPIVAIGRGLTVTLALASLAGLTDTALVDRLVGHAGMLTTLGFSRRQEARADAAALIALQRIYGHAGGAQALFETLAASAGREPPTFFSTHPLSARRIERITRSANARGPLTPIPRHLRQ